MFSYFSNREYSTKTHQLKLCKTIIQKEMMYKNERVTSWVNHLYSLTNEKLMHVIELCEEICQLTQPIIELDLEKEYTQLLEGKNTSLKDFVQYRTLGLDLIEILCDKKQYDLIAGLIKNKNRLVLDTITWKIQLSYTLNNLKLSSENTQLEKKIRDGYLYEYILLTATTTTHTFFSFFDNLDEFILKVQQALNDERVYSVYFQALELQLSHEPYQAINHIEKNFPNESWRQCDDLKFCYLIAKLETKNIFIPHDEFLNELTLLAKNHLHSCLALKECYRQGITVGKDVRLDKNPLKEKDYHRLALFLGGFYFPTLKPLELGRQSVFMRSLYQAKTQTLGVCKFNQEKLDVSTIPTDLQKEVYNLLCVRYLLAFYDELARNETLSNDEEQVYFDKILSLLNAIKHHAPSGINQSNFEEICENYLSSTMRIIQNLFITINQLEETQPELLKESRALLNIKNGFSIRTQLSENKIVAQPEPSGQDESEIKKHKRVFTI